MVAFEAQVKVQGWLKKTASALLRGCVCARSLLWSSRTEARKDSKTV
jgi:hypothetical protein